MTPVSLVKASVGADGAGGGVVSTEKLNAETGLPELGFSSLPVSTCTPSGNGTVVRMQTLPKASEVKVPIDTPSIDIWYEAALPSPAIRNDGVALRLAVLSDPTCRF